MKHSRSRFAFARTGVLCAIALLSVGMACEARMPTSADVDAMSVAGAERTAIKAKLLAEAGESNRIYMVDGNVISEAEAHAILPSKIASVDIRKGKSPGAKDEIKIYTLNNPKAIDDAIAKKRAELNGTSFKIRSRVPDSASLRMPDKGQLSKRQFDGVVIINGLPSTSKALSELSPDQIESVEVIKGQAAMKSSNDPAAQYGIISVKLKNAKQ